MRQNEFASILRAIELIRVERAKLSMLGPHFMITHRFWQRHTICTPGEAITNTELVYHGKRFSIPLSLRLMLLLDYLARHQHLPQCAAHIAAGLSVDPFTQQHGAYAGTNAILRRKVSRTAVKQQIMRLRRGLQQAFRKAGLSLDPERVLISEATTTNEVRYRLKAGVIWEHRPR